MAEKRITKLVRVYKKNEAYLESLKSMLTEEWGRQASFADAINFLIRYYKRQNERNDNQKK